VPIIVAIPTATKPTFSEILAPKISLESTSLPSISVPKGWEGEGGMRMAFTSILKGS